MFNPYKDQSIEASSCDFTTGYMPDYFLSGSRSFWHQATKTISVHAHTRDTGYLQSAPTGQPTDASVGGKKNTHLSKILSHRLTFVQDFHSFSLVSSRL